MGEEGGGGILIIRWLIIDFVFPLPPCLNKRRCANKLLSGSLRWANWLLRGAPRPLNLMGPKLYKFIRFGAMEITKPYKFIRFGAMEITKPYKFIGFGAMDVTK